MRRKLLISLLLAACALRIPDAHGLADRILEIVPGGILANFQADGFTLRGTDGSDTPAIISAVPSVALGLDIEQPQGFIDAKVGVGMLLNSAFSSVNVFGSLGYSLEVQPGVIIGPHVSVGYYTAPNWWGDLDVGFSDSVGYAGGIHFNMGDRVAYLVSLDYVSVAFDVEDLPPGVTANSDRLDMSGIAVQFGIVARF